MAYLRFASVYRGFETLADFEDRDRSSCGQSAPPSRTGCRRPGVAGWTAHATVIVVRIEGSAGEPRKGEVMTETVSGAAARGGKRVRKGLKMKRIFTTPGVHPYDEVHWERRDVVMTNWRDGSINFEQRGVEFPEFWSVNAANIVTTKYFRGAVGTPQREWSLKQLVDRVVGVYTGPRCEHGYFATEEDAEIFDHELKHALVHQVFSFNSPVWFNVGTASPAAGLARASSWPWTTRWSRSWSGTRKRA